MPKRVCRFFAADPLMKLVRNFNAEHHPPPIRYDDSQKDQPPITPVIAKPVRAVAIRSPSVPKGDGQCFALLRMRIATVADARSQ